MRVLVLQGPNLNLLGSRETEVYGTTTLDEIHARLSDVAAAHAASVTAVQSNHEGVLIDEIQNASGVYDGLLINPGGLSHTSVALRDALAGAPPTVVVHLSNIHAREPFRRRDLVAPACVGGVYGLGPDAYELGLIGLLRWLRRHAGEP